MEMDHRRDRMRPKAENGEEGRGAGTYAAVDLRQFQNTEVGKGYQARHVVRQKIVSGAGDEESSQLKILNMSQRKHGGNMGENSVEDVDAPRKSGAGKRGGDQSYESGKERRDGRKRTKEQNSRSKCGSGSCNKRRPVIAEHYLECKGIRDFRREIEKILSSS